MAKETVADLQARVSALREECSAHVREASRLKDVVKNKDKKITVLREEIVHIKAEGTGLLAMSTVSRTKNGRRNGGRGNGGRRRITTPAS